MSNITTKLQERRRHDTKLSTGLHVVWHKPDVQECILKVGTIPLPVLAMAKEKPTAEEATRIVTEQPEAMARTREFQRQMVAAMLDEVEGEPIGADDDRLEIVDLLDPIERQELFLMATRQKDPDSGEA